MSFSGARPNCNADIRRNEVTLSFICVERFYEANGELRSNTTRLINVGAGGVGVRQSNLALSLSKLSAGLQAGGHHSRDDTRCHSQPGREECSSN
jgi:hypothetical protein